MTMGDVVEVECPKCGGKQATNIWRTINVSVNPELKQALFDGRINVFRCSKCGCEAPIGVDLLYHDMHEQFWVQFYPFEWLNNDRGLARFGPDGEMGMGLPSELSNLPLQSYVSRAPHVVFDMGELVRYVLFRDKLCRRCLEDGATATRPPIKR